MRATTPSSPARRGLAPVAGLTVFALTILSACLSSTVPASPGVASVAATQQLRVRVTNRGHADVIVYLAGGTAPLRLGRVPATRRADLVFPAHSAAGARIQLLLRDAGTGASYSPEPIWSGPRDVVELTVNPLLSTSELTVR
jgi:hypothetical protein